MSREAAQNECPNAWTSLSNDANAIVTLHAGKPEVQHDHVGLTLKDVRKGAFAIRERADAPHALVMGNASLQLRPEEVIVFDETNPDEALTTGLHAILIH